MKQLINQKLNRLFKLSTLLSLGILTTISGCGGGGGDDASTAAVTPPVTPPPVTPPPTTTPDPEPDPEPTAEPTSLDDLIVAPDNPMASVFQLDVDISLTTSKRAYFSLCDDYSDNNNLGQSSYTVNFESCLYRGPLDSGKLNTDITIANHNGELIAVVWFYDGSQPSYKLWQYDPELEQQKLTVN
ncbi:hypothetical protein FM038_016390 [Shewanella eurypsychrophilus]|uniref:Lipoprotein n=1 Tax=Shewanella eurypsychrophilus TaxID=2593656 RepID=A0ABX6V8R5_9GAMM|nr:MULTISPECIES: hypothetical protein [Shewanella]QFU23598.1 hypothetical protein FS418_18190 [Shewanella sp. YLB-09]QPG58822.1 hypothetical protein FM038_016390 [Shewanella eurypsychrophilus]